MSEYITGAERYGSAAGKGLLRQRDERVMPVDVIAAAGFASRREGLGLALWKAKYANDHTSYRQVHGLLQQRVANTARRRRWKEPPATLRLLTSQVLTWLVFGICPVCLGRGHPVMGDAEPTSESRQVLKDDLCPACHGDAVTPMERAVNVELVGRAKDILVILGEADTGIAQGLQYFLRGTVVTSEIP